MWWIGWSACDNRGRSIHDDSGNGCDDDNGRSVDADEHTSGADQEHPRVGDREGRLGTLLGLLDTAGMTATLEGDGPFTLVAPTDDAFKKMNADTLDQISKSPEVLTQLLNYHLINGRVLQSDLDAGFVASAEGTPIALQPTDQFPTLNGQTVVRAGRATNGTILLIDTVLLPVDLRLP